MGVKFTLRRLLWLQLIACIIAWNLEYYEYNWCSKSWVLNLGLVKLAYMRYSFEETDHYIGLFSRDTYMLEGVRLYPEPKWYYHNWDRFTHPERFQ